jgi:hypothetical protein
MELSARTLVQLPEDMRDDYRERLLQRLSALAAHRGSEPPQNCVTISFPT